MSKKRSLRHEECDDDPLPKSKKPCRKIKGPKLPEHIKEIKDLSVLIEVAEFIEKQQSRRKKEQGLWKLSLCIDDPYGYIGATGYGKNDHSRNIGYIIC